MDNDKPEEAIPVTVNLHYQPSTEHQAELDRWYEEFMAGGQPVEPRIDISAWPRSDDGGYIFSEPPSLVSWYLANGEPLVGVYQRESDGLIVGYPDARHGFYGPARNGWKALYVT